MYDEATPVLLSINDAAKALGVARSTLYILLAAGDLRSVTIGRRRFVRANDLTTFVESLPEAAPGGDAA